MNPMRTVKRGARGEAVRDVLARLAALGAHIEVEEHGTYGPSTDAAVREFQQRRGLLVDGMVGPHTWEELVEAGFSLGERLLYLRFPSYRGDDVRALQGRLNLLGFDAGKEDGILGERTDRAVRDFQRNVGLPVDGIAGATTVEALARLRPVGSGPGRAKVREGEVLSRLSATLKGARIAVDAGHGDPDLGATGPSGTTEAELCSLVAVALFDELSARGANPFLLRALDGNPSPRVRAQEANQAGAEVVLSIHLNSHEDPAAEGASAFYFGREGWESQAGRRLADLILHELTTRVGLKDARSHPKALQLLRETLMPAVQVEPCFITNPHEEARLLQREFHLQLAMAVADAVERFFAGGASEDEDGSAGGATAAGQ
jgi:N-acetylmuramoyl-L-alanine amidase